MCSPPAPGVLPQPQAQPQPHQQPSETSSFLVRIMRVGGPCFVPELAGPARLPLAKQGSLNLGTPPNGAHASLEPDPSLDTVRAHTPGTCVAAGCGVYAPSCSHQLTSVCCQALTLGAHCCFRWAGLARLVDCGNAGPGPVRMQRRKGRWPESASQAWKSGSCPLSSWAWSLDQHLGPGQAVT